jgi:hypothetical protein
MRASQLPGQRAWQTEGCDGQGSLLEYSGNVSRKGNGEGLFGEWQLLGVGWCRLRFCGRGTCGFRLQVWLLQPLLWLGPQRLLLLPLLLLPLLLLWLLSFLSRWLQLLWNICSTVYLTATPTTHQTMHNEPEAFQPFNGPNGAQLWTQWAALHGCAGTLLPPEYQKVRPDSLETIAVAQRLLAAGGNDPC